MVIPRVVDPWIDTEPKDRVKAIRRDLELSRRTIKDLLASERDLRGPAQSYCKAIDDIMAHLLERPDDWRRIRAFIVVDIPAILQAAEGLSSLPAGEARGTLVASLKQALAAAAPKAATLAEARAADLTAGLDVLPSASGQDADENGDGGTGFLGGLTRKARQINRSATALTRDTVESSARLTSRAVAAAGGLTELSGTYVGSFIGDVGRGVTRPVTLRVAALRDAVTEGGLTVLVVGGITSLIFPPLAPFVVGEAMLSMPDSYASRLSQLSEAEARSELARRGEHRDRINEIMATLRGGPMRFDTPCLSITMDPGSGAASGIILRGCHTGEALESLDMAEVKRMRDTAPDEETGRALNAWISRQA
jgi:hypothetical protein